MSTFLWVAFLVAHGLLHLAIWLPRPEPDPDRPPPFEPDHSGVLTALHVPTTTTHRLSTTIAVVAAVSYVVAGLGVALSTSWVVGATVVAAVVGIVLKAVYFHPWLTIGLALDGLVLSAALASWPIALP